MVGFSTAGTVPYVSSTVTFARSRHGQDSICDSRGLLGKCGKKLLTGRRVLECFCVGGKAGAPSRVTCRGPVLGWVKRCLAGSARDWNHEYGFTKRSREGKCSLVRGCSRKRKGRGCRVASDERETHKIRDSREKEFKEGSRTVVRERLRENKCRGCRVASDGCGVHEMQDNHEKEFTERSRQGKRSLIREGYGRKSEGGCRWDFMAVRYARQGTVPAARGQSSVSTTGLSTACRRSIDGGEPVNSREGRRTGRSCTRL